MSGAVSSGEVVEALRRKVVELSEGNVGEDEIDPAASLLDHGYVDSLSSVRLLGFIKERFGVDVPETELVGRAHSLEGLAEFVLQRSAS